MLRTLARCTLIHETRRGERGRPAFDPRGGSRAGLRRKVAAVLAPEHGRCQDKPVPQLSSFLRIGPLKCLVQDWEAAYFRQPSARRRHAGQVPQP